jgi:hypothetical protein
MSTVAVKPGIPGKLLYAFAVDFNRVIEATEIRQPTSQPDSFSGVILLCFETPAVLTNPGFHFLLCFL